jgi:hypothetical protein
MKTHDIVRITALAACAAVTGIIITFLVTHVGQDPLQFVHDVDDYQALLLQNPAALRVGLAFDNAFIVFYASMFVALGARLRELGRARARSSTWRPLVSSRWRSSTSSRTSTS